MPVSPSSQHPPLLLRQQPQTDPALEALLFQTVPGARRLTTHGAPTPKDHIDRLTRQVQVGEDYNRYVFAQIVMACYARIFATSGTSEIYGGILRTVLRSCRAAAQTSAVSDRSLRALIDTYMTEDRRWSGRDFVDALAVVRGRLQPELAYPGIDELIAVISAMYDDRTVVVSNVHLFGISLCQVDGHTAPTLSLAPLGHVVTLDTTEYRQVDNLLWKLIYSLNLPQKLEGPGELTGALWLLASLALPLDPIALTTDMRASLLSDRKAGIPFVNYLAMYLKQRSLGLDYTLSRLADPRRRLMQQAHRFCGVGATCVSDAKYLRYFLDALDKAARNAPRELFSENERDLLQALELGDSNAARFVCGLDYRAGLEAAQVDSDPDDEDTATPAKSKAKPTEDKPAPKASNPANTNATTDDTDGAFADDADRITSPAEPAYTSDDNIDQTGASASSPAPRSVVSKLLPLALPTETIDDHLYRLAVLSYVSDQAMMPVPDVTPEDLGVLQAWCGSYLFLAAAAATRSVISQLNLTGKLKEFLA